MIDLITDHACEPWTYTNGETVCIWWDRRRLRTCDRPPEEHERVDEDAKALDDQVAGQADS